MGEAVVSSEEMGVRNTEMEESSVVKWERFLPRMSLRVLLVEADDSTRQIISALLRKCSYKVASVADGLKAWEILKARPNEIDLILTEVDLPSVSGFALLTLIMEHEICKNIPVIMMSSHDSVSTVYSCMLRGAADYLVKPIRRNELRNLWQHVWRRQSASSGGNYIQMESEAEKKVEGTSENNAVCNDSSSYTGSAQRNMENGNKESEAGGGASVDLQNVEPESEGRDGNIASEASDNNDELVNAGREAIDLIGALNDHQKECSYKKNTSSASNFDSCPQLDLSLKRPHAGTGFELENHGTEKRRMINHSDASAFSLYTNRPQKHLLPAQTCEHIRENESEVAVSTSQRMVFAVPIPVREVKLNSIRSNYGPVLPSAFCTQSVPLPSPSPSPSSMNHKEPGLQGRSEQMFDQRRLNVNACANQNLDRGLEECRQINNGNTDQSGSSGFYNGATSHLHSIGYGSISLTNSNVDHVAAGESKNEEGLCGSSHRSLQREAALNKFRLKRKDRCFEKKVRYESRKKLAEQRPRVKGQFVRHVQSDVTPVESEN